MDRTKSSRPLVLIIKKEKKAKGTQLDRTRIDLRRTNYTRKRNAHVKRQGVVNNTAVDNWISRRGNCFRLGRNALSYIKSYISRRNGNKEFKNIQ